MGTALYLYDSLVPETVYITPLHPNVPAFIVLEHPFALQQPHQPPNLIILESVDTGEHPVLVDNVNHPSHYNDGGLECIEAIEAQLTPEEYRGYLKGNVAKYVWREKHKGGIESLKKAQWYLDKLVNLEY